MLSSSSTQERLPEKNKTCFFAFPERLRNPKAIVLNPPFDVVKQRLECRWMKKEKKWNEDNLDYLRAACEEYEVYRENPNVLYLEDNGDVERVLEWLSDSFQLHEQNI